MIRRPPRSTLFPYTRSSDLHTLPMKVSDAEWQWDRKKLTVYFTADQRVDFRALVRDHPLIGCEVHGELLDRKSTRLNSSHSQISEAVFCLEKNINNRTTTQT